MKITNLVKENIEKYGAQVFYDSIENCWDEWSNEIQKTILEDIYKEIKPDKIETIQDLAKLLDGNYNGDELENPYNINIEELCKKNKWVVLFPYSDDNLEARGYIDDEVGAWDGTNVIFYKKGEFYPEDLDEETFKKASEDMICVIDDNLIYDSEVENGHIGVKMEWDPDDQPYTWYMTSKYENIAYFDIVDEDDEDNKTWARCCVIDLSNI